LSKNFSSLNSRRTQTDEDSLLDGEKQDSLFTFLGTETQRERNEITEMDFIPGDSELGNTNAIDKIQETLTKCNYSLEQ
jgi:hypothetical protein